MADTAHKDEEEKKEFFDSPEELEEKLNLLRDWILSSEHFVAFTGAGISTSAGIPDYRSGEKTVLETGPGCWTKSALEKEARAKGKAAPKFKNNSTVKTTIQKALPTSTHMALV